MKRTVLAIALMLGAVCANAQETTSSGDLYQGLTRKIAFERMIPPHLRQDGTHHLPLCRALCRFGFAQSHCGEGGRCGKRYPCESDGQRLP